MRPMAVDQPPEGLERPMPRRWQPPVGWNLPQSPPGSEGLKLCDFQTLRTLSRLYSVARACIQLLKSEIRALEWDIVPTKDAAKAMRGDHKAMRDFGERRSECIRFFKNPDPEYGSWSSWLDTLLEDIYSIDALSVYLRPSRVRGRGLMGSDLSALELIDGTSIRPLVDLHGSRPSPPSVAFQQYLFGVPRSDLMTIMMGADLPDGMKGTQVQEYRGDQLLYLPYTRATDTPYGLAPVEQALVPVMSGLSKQGMQLDYFREGSVPSVYISPGDAAMTASQIRDLQDALNILAGDVGFKWKVVVLPAGSKVMPQKDPALADAFDQIVSVEVCMAFQVQPTELGLMPQVAVTQSPSAMNQAAKADAARHQRKSLVPMLQFLKQGLLDKVIQVACGQTDMQFLFEGLEEDEDEVSLTGLLVTQIGGGLRSVDEGRGVLGLDPWGLPVTQDPLWASANGVMLLGSVDPATGQPAGEPAALPSVTQQMQGAQGGSSQANAGQVNPRAALAQGHMPGTTHVPPAQPKRDPTPSHSAAIAGAAEAAAAVSGSSAKAAGSVIAELVTAPDASALGRDAVAALEPGRPVKAVLAELDALGRHVRKGRDPATWQPVHIPGHVMAMITEDMAKGIPAAEVLTAAAGSLPKAAAAEGGGKPQQPGSWLAWEHDEALAARYGKLIGAAFAAVIGEAAVLFGQWLAGTLPVTAAVLAGMAADLVRDRLALILASLHAEGYALGHQAATQAAGHHGQGQAAPAQGQQGMAELGRQAAVRQMSATGMAGLAAALAKALLAGGVTVAVLLALLEKFLRADRRAHLIAWTELLGAIQDGAAAAYAQLGVTWVRWVSVPDSRRCVRCKANTDASPQPLGAVWAATGDVQPPAHPACRCALLPALPPAAPVSGPPAPGVTKAAKPWKHPGPSLSPAGQAYAQMAEDYPPASIAWMKDATWTGPALVSVADIEYEPAEWQAGHEPAKVERFRARIERRQAAGKPVKPVVLIRPPGNGKLVVVDGHHRLMAFHELGQPALAYVGAVGAAGAKAAEETHASQVSTTAAGADQYAATAKNFTAGNTGDGPAHGLMPYDLRGQEASALPAAAGLAVRAADTGRVLMLQRAISEDDPAGGTWEFPGGCLDPGETPPDTAAREWAEETGRPLPDGLPGGMWVSRNGVYQGFVYTVPSEDAIPVNEGRDQVINPDDPDGDQVEAIAWWDVSQLPGNPAVRPELTGDLDLVLPALAAPAFDPETAGKSAQTPYLSAVHHPLGQEGLWHTPSEKVPVRQQLPAYVQNIARAMMRDRGMDEREAIAMAVAAVERWRHGNLEWGPRRHVTPEVEAASERTHAEWEAERAAHH
jgi:8-oxo-dGTP pyrophosphatase MutT (NUDIX family)